MIMVEVITMMEEVEQAYLVEELEVHMFLVEEALSPPHSKCYYCCFVGIDHSHSFLVDSDDDLGTHDTRDFRHDSCKC